MTWQTDYRDWLSFPWACENCDPDEATNQGDILGEGEEEIAVLCRAMGHRILESECLGMECKFCKLRHHDKFIEELRC